jgi:FixJ family two-component response regulator
MTSERIVFVLDDDASARLGLTRLLRTVGYDARGFGSAEAFRDAFYSDMSGCLVLDARMPGLSWEELIAELKTCGARLPIIVVTADDDPVVRRKAEEIKAAAFFRKPVDGTELIDAVRWAMEQTERS